MTTPPSPPPTTPKLETLKRIKEILEKGCGHAASGGEICWECGPMLAKMLGEVFGRFLPESLDLQRNSWKE